MSLTSCPRVSELASALKAGHARSAWDSSLREHVDACRHCADYLVLSETLHAAREASMHDVPALSPGLLWWRAQLRRRNQALQQIGRPTAIIGKLALLSTAIVAVVALLSQRREGAEWLRWLFGLQDGASLHHATLAMQSSFWNLLLGVVSLGAIAALGALALFLATDKS